MKTVLQYYGRTFDSLQEYIYRKIDGENLEEGALEKVTATVQTLNKALSQLIELLVEKEVLTEEEVENNVLKEVF